MYLKRLIISNYKSFYKPTELNFESGFNVLLGANSSGKTSILEAIAFHELQNIPHRSISNTADQDAQSIGTTESELRFASSPSELRQLASPANWVSIGLGDQHGNFYTQDLNVLQARLRADPLCVDIQMSHIRGHLARIGFENWLYGWRSTSGNAGFPGFQLRTSDGEMTPPQHVNATHEDLQSIWQRIHPRIYRFSAERQVHPMSGHHQNGELTPTSSNLAFCMNHLQTNNTDLFQTLNRLIHRVFPTIHWVGAPPTGSNQFELKIHTSPSRINRGDLAIPINRVGTGVGNALAMLYVALTAQTQRFILLEEPNSFLHPRALRELLAILAEIGAKHQFFVTTHSSDVLRTINASTVTLLEYDGQQTTIQQTSGSQLHSFKAGLVDLGIRLTDLHGCDRVLWVEGETEEAVFPLLLQRYFPELAQGIAVLSLHSTGDFESRRIKTGKIAGMYKRLSEASFLAPPMVAITLDREKRSQSEIAQTEKDCEGIVHFLPAPMLEDYLLVPEAIAAILTEEIEKPVSLEEVNTAYQKAAADSNNRLFPENPVGQALHAANTMSAIFAALHVGLEYRKADHGLKIAEWILNNRPDHFRPLKEWFTPFLKP